MTTKVLTYTPLELRLADFANRGILRFDDAVEVTSPDEADFIICPISLWDLKNSGGEIEKLPWMKGHSRKHVFFDVADNGETFPGIDSIFLRCYLTKDMQRANPRSLCVAWPTSSSGDYTAPFPVPADGFKFDVSYRAWLSSDTRKQCAKSITETFGDRADTDYLSTFTGYCWQEEEGLRRRREFRRSMTESRLMICPSSIPGIFAYRFWEGMAAGRVSVLFCSNHVWPFEWEVDWKSCCFEFPAERAHEAGPICKEILATHDDKTLIEMGMRARAIFEKYVDDRIWPNIHRRLSEKAMRT